jgi:hypothetical protein
MVADFVERAAPRPHHQTLQGSWAVFPWKRWRVLNPPNRRDTDPYARWCGWGGIARWPPISIDRSEHRGSSVLTHRPCGSLPAVGITVLFAVRPLPSATSASGGSAPPCHERDPLVAAAGRMSRSPAPVLARTGRLPYLWTHVTNEADRGARLHEGLISTARIILLGLVMDSVYQFMMLKMFYPAESVIVALALAFLPYVLLRGPISRTARCGSSKAVTDDVR